MNQRQSQRIGHIERVKGIIKRCKKEGRTLIYKQFVLTIMSVNKVSDRTAKEYIRVALFELELTKEDICTTSV